MRVRRLWVEAASRLTTKGQVTIPKAVREALGLTEGDSVVFRVEGKRAILARTADPLELAGRLGGSAANVKSGSVRRLVRTIERREQKRCSG